MSAAIEPAVWRAVDAPSTIILEPAPVGFSGVTPEVALKNLNVLVDITGADGRHLVLEDRHGRHRLIIRDPDLRTGHACMIIPDACQEIRMAAVSLLLAGPGEKRCMPALKHLRPSDLQRHRLTIMLRILDCLGPADGHKPSIREIAMKAVYPWADFGRSIEWKASSARRQTQRLTNEAVYMAEGGYRNLLNGNIRLDNRKTSWAT